MAVQRVLLQQDKDASRPPRDGALAHKSTIYSYSAASYFQALVACKQVVGRDSHGCDHRRHESTCSAAATGPHGHPAPALLHRLWHKDERGTDCDCFLEFSRSALSVNATLSLRSPEVCTMLRNVCKLAQSVQLDGAKRLMSSGAPVTATLFPGALTPLSSRYSESTLQNTQTCVP